MASNDDTGRPYKPAQIALASDLVIGLGINSAAMEGQFAGAPSFHFDLSRTENNDFVRERLGKIVFHSVTDMKEAIEKQMIPQTALSAVEINTCYETLDPFRGGRVVERMGPYISYLMEGFKEGKDKDAAITHAAKNYRRMWGENKIIEQPH